MFDKFKRFYKRWVKFGKKVAAFQTRFLFTLVYYIYIIPFGFVFKLTSKQYRSGWIKKETSVSDIEEARKQF